jgi:hypothetical protein
MVHEKRIQHLLEVHSDFTNALYNLACTEESRTQLTVPQTSEYRMALPHDHHSFSVTQVSNATAVACSGGRISNQFLCTSHII